MTSSVGLRINTPKVISRLLYVSQGGGRSDVAISQDWKRCRDNQVDYDVMRVPFCFLANKGNEPVSVHFISNNIYPSKLQSSGAFALQCLHSCSCQKMYFHLSKGSLGVNMELKYVHIVVRFTFGAAFRSCFKYKELSTVPVFRTRINQPHIKKITGVQSKHSTVSYSV